MSRKWTDSQLKAINTRNSNVLVSAAAGSGKTAVLVERIVKLIAEDGFSIDDMLVVTFTKAAAAEMRERIMIGISEYMTRDDVSYDLAVKLRRESVRLNGANISTMHSFCNDILNSYFFRLGLDANMAVGEKSEIESLVEEAMGKVFEYIYSFDTSENLGETNKTDVLETVESLSISGKADGEARDAVIEIYRFIMTKPEPEKWLDEKISEYTRAVEDQKRGIWVETLESELYSALLSSCDRYEKAIEAIEQYEGLKKLTEFAVTELEALSEVIANARLIGGFKFKKMPSIKSDTLKREEIDAKEVFKDKRGVIKKRVDEASKIETLLDEKTVKRHMKVCEKRAKAIKYLVVEFKNTFKKEKEAAGVYDYSDLEHYMIQLLQEEDIRRSLQSRFKHIFIDEYQDTNEVQEYIVNSISNGDDVFAVGDVKQSIYRFRLADPEIFIEKYEKFKAQCDGKNEVIDLSMNFRSHPELLKNVNSLFENIMSKTVGGVVYGENAKLHPSGREFESDELSGTFELNAVQRSDERSKKIGSIESEAIAIGNKIKEIVNDGMYGYSDIVILTRSVKKVSDKFASVFKAMDIPLFSEAGESAFDTLEIKLMINALKAIDNSNRDIPLISLMHSPVCGFSMDELIKLSLFRGNVKSSYIDVIERLISENDKDNGMTDLDEEFYERYNEFHLSDIMPKLVHFHKTLQKWKNMSEYLPIDILLTDITESTGYVHYIASMENGIQRTANLRLLIERAAGCEKGQTVGLGSFIAYIEKLKKNKMDLDIAKIGGDGDNVVRLMTIHKSKGLEFKIVIVAGAGDRFNISESKKPYILHKSLGLGLDFIDVEKGYKTPTVASTAVKLKNGIESKSEEMRILYVALTRGIDRIYVFTGIATNTSAEKRFDRWSQSDAAYIENDATSFADWIGASLHMSGSFDKINVVETIDVSTRDDFFEEGEHRSEQAAFATPGGGVSSLECDAYHEFKAEIERRLNFPYGNPGGKDKVAIPQKISVSALIRGKKISERMTVVPELSKKPGFMNDPVDEGKVSSIQSGNEIHKALQMIKLNSVASEEEINFQIDEMIKNRVIRTHESITGRIKKSVISFLNSDVGKRMNAASEIYREKPFLFRKEIDGQSVMVQGVIDCYFKENDGYVIIDYKSGGSGFATPDDAVSVHRYQLNEYKEAIEGLTGECVKDVYLCLPEREWYIKINF